MPILMQMLQTFLLIKIAGYLEKNIYFLDEKVMVDDRKVT